MSLHCLQTSCDFFRQHSWTKPYIHLADSVQQLQGYRAAIVLSYKLHDSCTMTLWKLQGVGKLTVRLSCNYVHSCTILVLLIEIAPKQKAVKENDAERPQVLSQKSPRDSRISSCIRVSKCPRVTRLKKPQLHLQWPLPASQSGLLLFKSSHRYDECLFPSCNVLTPFAIEW